MIPVTPNPQRDTVISWRELITENCEVIARDLDDVLARRWLRFVSIGTWGATSNSDTEQERTVWLWSDGPKIITGINFHLYTADTLTVTLRVDGDDVWAQEVDGKGATVRSEWVEGLNVNVGDGVFVELIISGTGTWSLTEGMFCLAWEHDRFEGAPPTPPTPPRSDRTDAISAASALNTFISDVATTLTADTAASAHADIDFIRGPTGVAHSTVTSTLYTIQLPDVGRTLRAASLFVVADSGVTVQCVIKNKGGTTLTTLSCAGTGASGQVVDINTVGSAQPDDGTSNPNNDWTAVFSVTAGSGTIHTSGLVLEWE